MNIFNLRDELIDDYAEYIASFINVRDRGIRDYIDEKLKAGVVWPPPLGRICLAKGYYWNVGKKGSSLSIGAAASTMNVRKKHGLGKGLCLKNLAILARVPFHSPDPIGSTPNTCA
jgi:hypothetical protein